MILLESFMQSLPSWLPWLVGGVLGLFILALLAIKTPIFGIISIDEDEIGIVIKKFVLFGANKTLPDGKIIALNGEAGIQADTLPPGLHFWYWPWQYTVEKEKITIIEQGYMGCIISLDGKEKPNNRLLCETVECDNFQDARAFLLNGGEKGMHGAYINEGGHRINTRLFKVVQKPLTEIPEDMIGIITMRDGRPLPEGSIAGDVIPDHDNFQNPGAFLKNGGFRGLQQQMVLSGTWKFNPWLVEVELIKMTEVPIGHAGVIISFVGNEGQDISGEAFKYGSIVSKGEKGVWKDTLPPGKYPFNTRTGRIELVPTTNLVLNWAQGVSEAHALDRNLSSIAVRSNDGFRFNLDVSQIIHIPATEAPKVISRVGSLLNLVTQVLEPMIGNYFRNSAQKSDVISFLNGRSDRQKEAKELINNALAEYDVQGVDTLIGDITPPEELMKTLTDRKIASENQQTFKIQEASEKQRQELEEQRAIADNRKSVVASAQGILIADNNAQAEVKKAEGSSKAMILAGDGEASRIRAVGLANAEAFTKGREAMGDEYAKLQIIESIGKNKVTIMPKILVTGGSQGGGSNIAEALIASILDTKNTLTVGETKTEKVAA